MYVRYKDRKEWKYSILSSEHIAQREADNSTQPPAANPGPAVTPQATLEVLSFPMGADIEVDGKFVGNTPSSLGLPAGDHTVKVSKKGFAPWERKVGVSTGTVRISPELEPITATGESKQAPKKQ